MTSIKTVPHRMMVSAGMRLRQLADDERSAETDD